MNKTSFACLTLLASSLVLAGLLIVQVQDKLIPSAQASNLLTKDNYTFLTARTQTGQESLFVTDNINQKLMIYDIRLSGSAGRMDLSKVVDLTKLFEGGTKTGGTGPGTGRVRP